MNLLPFKELIRTRCGLEFNGIAEKPLQDAIELRLRALGLADESAYFMRLSANETEFEELVSMLTINETYFYREPDQINFFLNRLLPSLIQAKPPEDRVIRILSAGCSTGEEPYSLAIALTEKYGGSALNCFSITGGDIDKTALQKAKEGIYKGFSFRSLAPDIKARYFQEAPAHAGWKVIPEIQNLVQFHQFNLLSDPALCAQKPFDVIFFRNVSIYFNAETRRLMLENLGKLLTDSGLLLLGMAETLANDLGVFALCQTEGFFYFSKSARPEKPAQIAFFTHPPAEVFSVLPPKTPPLPPKGPSMALPQLLMTVREKHYELAQRQLAAALAESGPKSELLALKAFILLQKRDYQNAELAADAALAQDAWSIDACVVRGLAKKWQDNSEEAINWFKKAVYAKNECWQAHYYLAELYRSNQETEKAARAIRTVLNLLTHGSKGNGCLVIPLDLPVDEIRFLCENQLDKLRGLYGA